MSRRFPWNRLGIDQTYDTAAIRKAYADILRGLDVDQDIAGYAELRRARDEALWLAAQAQRAEEDDGDNFGLGDLGDLDDEAEDDARDDTAGDRLAADLTDDDDDYDPDEDWVWDDSPEAQHPDPLGHSPEPQLTEGQLRAQAAWQALRDLLYPDGEPSDESVTYAEMEEGLAHLEVLLERAAEADLLEHDALDGALAQLFASTWPRSAPFVEPANDAFHWLDESGSLEERPALRFLNQRLKGMRFHEKVQRPDHPLHKAWRELSRPGRASFIDRMRVKRVEIDKLLSGMRDRYPELESYLAPERVASWEGSSAGHGVGNTGPRVVRWVVVMSVLLILPRLLYTLDDPRPETPVAALLETGPSAEDVDRAVADIFGEGTTMAAVRKADPVFADQLRGAFNRAVGAEEAAIAFVRRKALLSSGAADFDALLVRAEVRGLWLTAAARQGVGVCQNFNAGDFASIPPELNEKQRARERVLLRKLLEAKVLSHLPEAGRNTYTIPGWMVGDVIERSGLGETAVRNAMSDAEDPNRCTIDRLLIESTLASPGRVSQDLLKGM